MADLEFPTKLVEAAGRGDDIALVNRGVAAVTRRTWMEGLARVLDDLARRWSLELGRPFQPGGVASWVAPARTRSGTQVVLKVAWRHDEALHEADGLRVWSGDGAVRLLDSLASNETTALLLESCQPGSTLSQVLPPLEQDVIVTGLLRRLWSGGGVHETSFKPAHGHLQDLGGRIGHPSHCFCLDIRMSGSPDFQTWLYLTTLAPMATATADVACRRHLVGSSLKGMTDVQPRSWTRFSTADRSLIG